MIYGSIREPETYAALTKHRVWQQAFEWIHHHAGNKPAIGIHPLIGDFMYANVMEYATVPRAQARYESHRKNIDLQFTISGAELIEWSLASSLAPDGGYEEAKDLQFYLPGESQTLVHMLPGHFGIFYPQDAHMPKLSDGTESKVFKLVIKIQRSLLEQ